MQRPIADGYLLDDGIGWRRIGVALAGVGLALLLAGLATVTLAATAWASHRGAGIGAIAASVVALTAGWSAVRHGDRLGPRLQPVVLRFGSVAADIPTTRTRIRVPSLPYAALPRGG